MIGLFIVAILLTSCKYKQAKTFINDQKTIEQAHKMVQEEAEAKYGITLKPSTVDFTNQGKSTNYDEIYVSYETIEEPIYHGRAFVYVDRKKRKWRLSEVNHLGMKHTQGLVSLGKVLHEDLLKTKYKMITDEINEYLSKNPKFAWDEEGPSVQFTASEPERENIEELFEIYGEGQFEHLTATQAEKYIEKIEPSDPKYETSARVSLDYKGEMDNTEMEQLIKAIKEVQDIDTLPVNHLLIRVKGDEFDEMEETKYNRDSDGKPNSMYTTRLTLEADEKEQ